MSYDNPMPREWSVYFGKMRARTMDMGNRVAISSGRVAVLLTGDELLALKPLIDAMARKRDEREIDTIMGNYLNAGRA